MPFNGSGTFTRLYSWVTDAANGVPITASRVDGEDNGFAAGLSNCITRDGQSPALANIPMGGFRITGLGAPSAANDAATKTYIDTYYLPLTGGTISGHVTFGASILNSTTSLEDAQMPILRFLRTAVGTWTVGGSGTAGDNSFNITLNAGSPSIMISTGGDVLLAPSAQFADTAFKAYKSGSSALLDFDGNDGLSYDRTANTMTTRVNSTAILAVSSTGAAITGTVTASSTVDGISPGSGSNGGVRIRGSSGGSQAYLQMTNNSGGTEWAHIRTEGSKLYISLSSTDVFSIDTSGNMRIKGTLTQNTTP